MTDIDPVCGMDVDPTTAEWKTEYRGQTYSFCAPGCQKSFEKEPEKYMNPDRPSDPAAGGAAHPA